jgi:putative SOS response-associated peptidase YedK
MCGRIAVTLPSDSMAKLFAALPANNLPSVPNYNICPTDTVHVVRSRGEGRALVAMRWGFVPQWYKTPNNGPLLINARAETIAGKPAFAEAVRARRCIIPASGYYEWASTAEGVKLPWYYTRKDGAPLAFAGIWQDWESADGPLATCAVVTTGSNAMAGKVHHRMPVILEPEAWGKWLGEEGRGAALLMTPAPEATLRAHRVNRAVNSNRAKGSELIEPLEGDEGA